jgi:hypothetical protein
VYLRGGETRLAAYRELTEMIERIRKFGWLAAEAGLLLIVLCILLNVLLGIDSGPFISSVSENASKFLATLPPGVTVGVALILLLYWFVNSRVS